VTLVGFNAMNHPQQQAKRGANPQVDDRATTWEDFTPLDDRFGGFTIDVAALPHNAKCSRYYTPHENGLVQPWSGERVWCNPPYSSIEPWVQKAHSEWALGGCELIVMLLPANRTEQGWWQRQVEPHLRAREPWFRVEFLQGRLRFIAHNATEIKPNERPPFGCCLLIWGPR
jgi:phage N-6-adenine-methyltransferase